jgi:hypothetical protein
MNHARRSAASAFFNGLLGVQYRLGDVEGHSAVLIALAYESSDKQIHSNDVIKIAYRESPEEKAATLEAPISPAGNLTWTPLVNDTVVGRASVGQGDDDRLNELLPKQ